MKKKTIQKIKSSILLAIMIVLAALFIYYAFGKMIPELLPVLKSGDDKAIANYLEGTNRVQGMASTAMLQFIQVLSIVLPGLPVHVAAGIVYGVWRGFLLCYVGYVSANMLIFLVARKLGSQKVAALLPMKVQNNWLEQKIKSANPKFVTILACLVPAVPNGIIPYIAAATDIKTHDFFEGVLAGSVFPIFTGCAAGQFFLAGEYVKGVLVMILSWLVIFLLYKNQNRFIKTKEKIEEELDEIEER